VVVADAELRRLSFIPLLVIDEVGYIAFDPEAANLMFSLVSAPRQDGAFTTGTDGCVFSRR
jgi:DNA replication protein DnaC